MPGGPTYIRSSALCAECSAKTGWVAPVLDVALGVVVFLCPGCLRADADVRLRG